MLMESDAVKLVELTQCDGGKVTGTSANRDPLRSQAQTIQQPSCFRLNNNSSHVQSLLVVIEFMAHGLLSSLTVGACEVDMVKLP